MFKTHLGNLEDSKQDTCGCTDWGELAQVGELLSGGRREYGDVECILERYSRDTSTDVSQRHACANRKWKLMDSRLCLYKYTKSRRPTSTVKTERRLRDSDDQSTCIADVQDVCLL